MAVRGSKGLGIYFRLKEDGLFVKSVYIGHEGWATTSNQTLEHLLDDTSREAIYEGDEVGLSF